MHHRIMSDLGIVTVAIAILFLLANVFLDFYPAPAGTIAGLVFASIASFALMTLVRQTDPKVLLGACGLISLMLAVIAGVESNVAGMGCLTATWFMVLGLLWWGLPSVDSARSLARG